MDSFIVPLASHEASDAGRFGPKAANQAALGLAGLPIPDGFCLDAEAYRLQVSSLDLNEAARGAFAATVRADARRHALRMRLELLEQPIASAVVGPLLAAWRELVTRTGEPTVVRSSALVEDRFGSSFAGQFESYLGIEDESEFLTAVRACWAALWSTRALRYMATHDIDPSDTAMAVLVQPLVAAKAAGGGLSRTATGELLVTATWGLGSSIAQGEVTPIASSWVSRASSYGRRRAGRIIVSAACIVRRPPKPCRARLAAEPCLDGSQISRSRASYVGRRCDGHAGRDRAWALDDRGFKLVQARPCICSLRRCRTRSGCSTRG